MRVYGPHIQTRQTRQRSTSGDGTIEILGRLSVSAGLSYQVACSEMEYLPRATFEGPAHQQHLAADVDTGQTLAFA